MLAAEATRTFLGAESGIACVTSFCSKGSSLIVILKTELYKSPRRPETDNADALPFLGGLKSKQWP